jgi:hypothetical protein
MVLVANVVLLIIVFSSAKTDEQPVIVKKITQFTSPEIPDSVFFAGEKMPIEQFDILEALDRELLSIAYFHSQTLRFIKLAPRYFSVIEPILKEYGIPEDFKYLAVAESSLDPRAVSPASAVGFWQFMRTTAKEFGLEITSEVDERYHVEKSTHAACKYLLNSYQKYENWTLVAASYNRGITGIEKQLTRQKTDNYYDLLLNSETQRYVFRIVALKLVMENPAKYNFIVGENEKYPIIKTREVEINGKVADFADFAHEYGISYKVLKDFNPWLRENFLTNAAGKKYIVLIPEME